MTEPKEGHVMRCHYEVLEIERSADDAEIRKAYRKLALKWHPDKNMHRHDEADKRFKEIASAYETLSDAHERSWYDSHRESILRGGDGTAEGGNGEAASASVPNVWKWYSVSSFSGFGVDEDGFYAVYQRAFEEIHQAEMASVPPNEEALGTSPNFGLPDSTEDQVRLFYSHWDGFVSKVTFAWCDKYNVAEAESRWVRRKMEQENKRLRSLEKKKYVDLVRNLSSFVKKRDPRMKQFAEEREATINARKQAQLDAEKQAKENYKRAKEEWKAQREIEIAKEQAEIEAQGLFRLADEDETEQVKAKSNVYRCDACSKTFKSDKQLSNHSKSKKHKDAMRKLINQLKQEEELAMEMMREELEEAEAAAQQSISEEGQSAQRDNHVQSNVSSSSSSDSDSSSPSDDSDSDAFLSAFAKMGKRKVEEASSDDDSSSVEKELVDVAEQAVDATEQAVDATEQVEQAVDATEQVEQAVDATEQIDQAVDATEQIEHAVEIAESEAGTNLEPTNACDSCKGKETQTRNNRKEANASESKESTNENLEEAAQAAVDVADQAPIPPLNEGDWKCSICSEQFPSRNKLFKHIKQSGHAALKTTASVQQSSKSKKSKRRKNKA